MASLTEQFEQDELNYLITFDTIIRILEMYDYETGYLAKKSGMPKHEMWEMRKAASEEIRKMVTEYMRQRIGYTNNA
jgi:hypothetical protein